ncbi:hypothetical protein GEMRC1_010996 [Eukaryota sp. GEM-RC1]
MNSFLPTIALPLLILFGLTRYTLTTFFYLPLLFLSVLDVRKKSPCITIFLVALISTLGSFLLYVLRFQSNILDPLITGTCSPILCLSPTLYHFLLCALSFTYCRLQNLTIIIQPIPGLSHPFTKAVFLFASFVAFPLPTSFISFIMASLYFVSSTTPYITSTTYDRTSAIVTAAHIIYYPLSSYIDLFLPRFSPLPLSLPLSLHVALMVFSFYLFTCPFFSKPSFTNTPASDQTLLRRESISGSHQLSLIPIFTFVGATLALFSSIYFKYFILYPIILMSMWIILFSLNFNTTSKPFKLLCFLLISISTLLLSYISIEQPLDVFKPFSLLAASLIFFFWPFSLRRFFSLQQRPLIGKIVYTIHTIDHLLIVFATSLFITINLPTLPFILSFLLSLHYILHPLDASKHVTNLIIFLSSIFLLFFYIPISGVTTMHCSSIISKSLGLCEPHAYYFSLWLFVLLSSLSHFNKFLQSFNQSADQEHAIHFPSWTTQFKAVIGVLLCASFLSLRICLLQLVILAIFVLLVFLPVIGVRLALLDLLGFTGLIGVIFMLFAVQYEPLVTGLSSYFEDDVIDVIRRYQFTDLTDRSIF